MPQKKPATATRSRRGFGRLRQRGSGRWQAELPSPRRAAPRPGHVPDQALRPSWLEDERDLIDLDRRKPGTWTPPAERADQGGGRKLTLRDYAKPWLEQRNISPRTRENYAYHLEHNISADAGRLGAGRDHARGRAGVVRRVWAPSTRPATRGPTAC